MKHTHMARSFIVGSVMAIVLFMQTGCSVFMAAKQPPKKDLEVMKEDIPRSLVLAEFGQPAATEIKDGKRVDVFSFTQGYSKVAKTARVLFHGVADVATFGLWEVVGTPTEAIFDGKKMAFEVTYDSSDKVEKVVELQK